MGLTPACNLAEHLIYTLPGNFDKHTALKLIEISRTAFACMSVSPSTGLILEWAGVMMLYDLIINPLPLMMIV
jgi:hypothetical protein